MIAKNLIIILILFWCVGCTGCINNVEKETTINNNTNANTNIQLPTELDKLILFLDEDKTDEKEYYDDIHRSKDYFVCTGFTRDLSENASKYNISLGGAFVRDTAIVGSISNLHAVNYGIFDNKFYFIDPQSDRIYTIDEYNYAFKYNYASLHKDANSISNYRISRKTIDIDFNDYNETKLIEKWR